MAFSLISRSLLRTSKEVLERNAALLNAFNANNSNCCPTMVASERSASSNSAIVAVNDNKLLQEVGNKHALAILARKYSKKHYSASTKQQNDSDSDSDSDDEYERKRQSTKSKTSERGDSEFWRRKMRTFHKILDVNHDGVISFEDFTLFGKRFTDLGHLTPQMSEELFNELKLTWEETFGEVTCYNMVTAEQFLTDFHHRLNDEAMMKRISKFLPLLFKAVDYDHSGYLDLEQYKLFFNCLGLSNDDAAIAFAVIDQNGDGKLSLKEFVHLGRQFFITEDEKKISKMFWGPLIDH